MTLSFFAVALRRSIALALATVALASCGSSTSPNNGSVSGVTVNPGSANVIVGDSVALAATVKGPDGQVIPGQHIFWNTENPSIATVSDNGVVTGVSQGQVKIAASAGGMSGISNITVLPAPVASVSVAPPLDTIVRPGTVQLTATMFDAQHNALSGRTVTWASNLPNVATVDTSGLVTGVAAGSATITATSEGQSGTSTIVVIPPPVTSITVAPPLNTLIIGDTVTLTAMAKDAAGATVPDAPLTWTSSNPSAATVSSTGLVTAVGGGTATITAKSGNASGTASVVVLPII